MPAAWSYAVPSVQQTRRITVQPDQWEEPPWTMLDATLLHLFAAEPRIGVLEASRRLGVARGTVQARLDKLGRTGVITGWGPRARPGGAGLPGDGVPDPGDPAGRRATSRSPSTWPASPRCSRRSRSPAPATCGPASWPAPTPTCSGSSTRCSPTPAIVRSSTVIALATQIPYRVLPLMDAAVIASRPGRGSLAARDARGRRGLLHAEHQGRGLRRRDRRGGPRGPRPPPRRHRGRRAGLVAGLGAGLRRPPRRRRGGRRRRPAARHGARRRGRHPGPRRPAVERQPLRPAGRRA